MSWEDKHQCLLPPTSKLCCVALWYHTNMRDVISFLICVAHSFPCPPLLKIAVFLLVMIPSEILIMTTSAVKWIVAGACDSRIFFVADFETRNSSAGRLDETNRRIVPFVWHLNPSPFQTSLILFPHRYGWFLDSAAPEIQVWKLFGRSCFWLVTFWCAFYGFTCTKPLQVCIFSSQMNLLMNFSGTSTCNRFSLLDYREKFRSQKLLGPAQERQVISISW